MGKTRGDEHACRVNYLFQAGGIVVKCAPQLSQYYGNVLTVITEKTAPKKDFTMKRSMCSKCQSILVIGENATYRLRKNRHRKGAPNIVIGCLQCGQKKRVGTSRGHKLKAEREGRVVNGVRHLIVGKTPAEASSSGSVGAELNHEREGPVN